MRHIVTIRSYGTHNAQPRMYHIGEDATLSQRLAIAVIQGDKLAGRALLDALNECPDMLEARSRAINDRTRVRIERTSAETETDQTAPA